MSPIHEREGREDLLLKAQLDLISVFDRVEPDLNQVQRKFDGFCFAWGKLMNAHIVYCRATSKEGFGSEEDHYRES